MPASYLPYQPDQDFLLPPALRDWLPQAKLNTVQVKQAYRKRKWIAEPPNGWIKSVLGLRQFSLRGLHRVQAEWKLVCTALNLRRMCNMTAAASR